MKDVWKCIVMDGGGQYVMMDLVQLMPGLYASSWDILIIQDMIICHCKVS